MYYREYSVKKFSKGGNLAGITEKDFANNRIIKKGNIEIELSKDYPTHYYAHFVDMSKEGGKLISVYADKNWNKVVKEIEFFKFAKGGNVENEGDLLLWDGKHIPEDVLEILRKYDDDIAEKNINGLRKMKQELRKIGYTIEIKSTGEIIDLREIGKVGHHTGKMAKGGRMDEGGSIMDYNDDVYDSDYDNDNELMGFNVMINNTKDFNKFKKFYVADADDISVENKTLFFSFDDEKNANKKIKKIENHFKDLNIDDYFIQNVYSS
jgi:hypothetical protein